MAATTDLSVLLSTLTDSLTSVISSLPDKSSLVPPQEGISLLDTKNELLLTYLQNLVFLIILKLRTKTPTAIEESPNSPLNDAVTQKLVELRVYIEKGVRPLESRLKYQLDKLLLTASEASTAAPPAQLSKTKPTPNVTAVSNPDSDSDAESGAAPRIPDLAHRPNPSAFARPAEPARSDQRKASDIYRPPRITPTALPTTERKSKATPRPRKSATLDEFVREEMGDAPVAEPSIGAGSGLKGREKEIEEARRGYEEQRLVRLPGEKKGKTKRRREAGEDLVGGFGGLGDIDFGNGGKGKGRKREREGEGERMGERWEKRVKKGVGRKRR